MTTPTPEERIDEIVTQAIAAVEESKGADGLSRMAHKLAVAHLAVVEEMKAEMDRREQEHQEAQKEAMDKLLDHIDCKSCHAPTVAEEIRKAKERGANIVLRCLQDAVRDGYIPRFGRDINGMSLMEMVSINMRARLADDDRAPATPPDPAA